MTGDRYYDTNGQPHDPALIHPPEGAYGDLAPDAAADWTARNERAQVIAERFDALAEASCLWQVIDSERIIRRAFGNVDAADRLAAYIEREKARIYAQIESEMDND